MRTIIICNDRDDNSYDAADACAGIGDFQVDSIGSIFAPIIGGPSNVGHSLLVSVVQTLQVRASLRGTFCHLLSLVLTTFGGSRNCSASVRPSTYPLW
jgi:hypothetical protein